MAKIRKMEIDTEPKKEEWLEVLRTSDVGIFQTPEIMEVYKRTQGYDPVCIGVRDRADSKLLAVLLGVVIEVRSGLLAPFSRWSTARGGPCLLEGETSDVSEVLLENFEVVAKKRGSLFSRIYPLYRGNKFVDTFRSNNWQIEEVYDFVSDLTLGSDNVWKKMKRGRKKNIRKAEKTHNVETSVSSNGVGLKIFLDHYDQTCKDRSLIPPHRSFFDAVLEILVKKGYAQIFLAAQDGDYIASKIVLTYQDMVYDWFAGSFSPARRVRANEKLVWDIIVWSAERGFKSYYYGGAETSEPVRGIYEFKQRFGGELVSFNRYVKVHRPIGNWVVDKVLPIYKRLVSRGQ